MLCLVYYKMVCPNEQTKGEKSHVLLPGNIIQGIVFTFREFWIMLLNVTIGQKQILQTTCLFQR